MLNYITEAKKIVIAACGFILALAGVPLFTQVLHWLPPSWSGAVMAIIALVTVVYGYLAPAETKDPARVEGRSVRLKGTRPRATAKAA